MRHDAAMASTHDSDPFRLRIISRTLHLPELYTAFAASLALTVACILLLLAAPVVQSMTSPLLASERALGMYKRAAVKTCCAVLSKPAPTKCRSTRALIPLRRYVALLGLLRLLLCHRAACRRAAAS